MDKTTLIEVIKAIKQNRTPPEKEGDTYYERSPWNKFGGVSSGVVMEWMWYRDEVILEKATETEILTAAKEMGIDVICLSCPYKDKCEYTTLTPDLRGESCQYYSLAERFGEK